LKKEVLAERLINLTAGMRMIVKDILMIKAALWQKKAT
jgi:hypothetical protein